MRQWSAAELEERMIEGGRNWIAKPTKENRMTEPTIPTPPAPPVAEVPPTLIQTLNAKLHAAHLDLDAAEQRVKDLENEIESLPAWAKELTAAELAARVDGWFK